MYADYLSIQCNTAFNYVIMQLYITRLQLCRYLCMYMAAVYLRCGGLQINFSNPTLKKTFKKLLIIVMNSSPFLVVGCILLTAAIC